MSKFYNIIAFVLLILAILCIIYNQTISEYFNTKTRIPKAQEQQITQNTKENQAAPKIISYTPINAEGIINIEVNRPTPLSGKSKKEVYDIRKNYVEKSIFKNQNYQPAEEVFGQIADGKPWIENYICHKEDGGPLPINGIAEETRFINNPTILIGLEYPFWFHNVTNPEFCDTDLSTMIPLSVSYDSSAKEITVEYRHLPFSTKNDHTFYVFNGLNAKDFGYKYVYLDKEKSTYDIEFTNESNISKDVYEFYNFIHLGYACNVEGGCNNGSPRQQFAEFKNNNPGSETG